MIRFIKLFFWLILPFSLVGQKNAFVLSTHKSISHNFGDFHSAHISYNKPLNNDWYLSIMGGFKSHEFIPHEPPETDRPRNHTVLDPDLEFALVDYVNIDPSITRTGMRQSKTKKIVRQAIPFGVAIGRNWLSNSQKLGLFTDIGGGLTYVHRVLYGWGEFVNFQGVEPPGDLPYFTLLGKSISRELRPHVDIKVEFSYFIFENLGLGVNFFMGGIIHFDTYDQLGIHLRYQY